MKRDRCHWHQDKEGMFWIPYCYGGIRGPRECNCPPRAGSLVDQVEKHAHEVGLLRAEVGRLGREQERWRDRAKAAEAVLQANGLVPTAKKWQRMKFAAESRDARVHARAEWGKGEH